MIKARRNLASHTIKLFLEYFYLVWFQYGNNGRSSNETFKMIQRLKKKKTWKKIYYLFQEEKLKYDLVGSHRKKKSDSGERDLLI